MFEQLASLLVYQWLALSPESHWGAALHFFVMDVARILVLLVIVIYVMGLLRALLSSERVGEFVRGSPDWQARGFAVTLGAVTPMPSSARVCGAGSGNCAVCPCNQPLKISDIASTLE